MESWRLLRAPLSCSTRSSERCRDAASSAPADLRLPSRPWALAASSTNRRLMTTRSDSSLAARPAEAFHSPSLSARAPSRLVSWRRRPPISTSTVLILALRSSASRLESSAAAAALSSATCSLVLSLAESLLSASRAAFRRATSRTAASASCSVACKSFFRPLFSAASAAMSPCSFLTWSVVAASEAAFCLRSRQSSSPRRTASSTAACIFWVVCASSSATASRSAETAATRCSAAAASFSLADTRPRVCSRSPACRRRSSVSRRPCSCNLAISDRRSFSCSAAWLPWRSRPARSSSLERSAACRSMRTCMFSLLRSLMRSQASSHSRIFSFRRRFIASRAPLTRSRLARASPSSALRLAASALAISCAWRASPSSADSCDRAREVSSPAARSLRSSLVMASFRAASSSLAAARRCSSSAQRRRPSPTLACSSLT
mmetsp:Transcript_30237/g.85446  ORF Transcript_30237/g.85446 Transcript_30237/m.85446 type:complete len:435 (-) Transcript_30237:1703-3007(-)